MRPLTEVTRIFITGGLITKSRNHRLRSHVRGEGPRLKVSRVPPRHLQLGSQSVGSDYKSFPTAGALRNASSRVTTLATFASSHTHTDMSTRNPPIEQSSHAAAVEKQGSKPCLMTCPTDGKIISSQYKHDDSTVECPHCTQVWDLEEVTHVAN